MLFYKVAAKGDFSKAKTESREEGGSGRILKRLSSDVIRSLHLFRHENCLLSILPSHDLFFCPCDTDYKTYIDFFVAFCTRGVSFDEVSACIADMIFQKTGVKAVLGEYGEITLESYLRFMDRADDDNMYSRAEMISSCPYMNVYSVTLLRKNIFEWDNGMVDRGTLDRDAAYAEFERLSLPGYELKDEIDRIYGADAVPGVFGHPVHYFIESSDLNSAVNIAEFIIRMLCSRGRLISGRYSVVHMNSYDHSSDDNDLLEQFMNLQDYSSTIVVFDGDSAEESGSVVSAGNIRTARLFKSIDKYSLTTQFFIVCIKSGKNIKNESLLASAGEHLRLVRLKTGFGSKEQARSYMAELIKKTGYEKWAEDGLRLVSKDTRTEFSLNNVHEMFKKWSRRILCNTVYDCYEKIDSPVKKTHNSTGSAYERLHNMIGLESVKEIIDRIIAVTTVSRQKTKLGIFDSGKSCHMIFTGNPGTAKTTVARLLAEILKEEKILSHGTLVECGRSDLVARYVGWTAKTVVSMFDRAEGGILFIDEAYSLCNDLEHGFGAEAVDTIVQEMENRRDRMIVILAGYAEPMKRMLDANQGLSSRIAFHVDFPDYGIDDLESIMELMLRENKLKITSEALEKCRGIYRDAVSVEGFGNGRFIRNLIESAQLRQALRLRNKYGRRSIPKKELIELVADDFFMPDNLSKSQRKTFKVGFTCK